MHRHPGWRAGRRPVLTTVAVVGALALGALGSCTRTHDLAAAPTDQTTTTARVPVRRVPRPTTTTVAPAPESTVPADVQAATTTVAPPPTTTPRRRRSTTPTTTPLAALLAALRAASATSVPPAAGPTTSTTTTTMIPANPAGVVVTAQNAIVHQGESQTITVTTDGDGAALPPLAGCTGRDYRPSGTGFVAAGFTTVVACGQSGVLSRTLPANVPQGQYVFCTELAGATTTTVCTAYIVVPYPT